MGIKARLPFKRSIQSSVETYIKNSKFRNLTKNWFFSDIRFYMLVSEYDDWVKHYGVLPLKNKVILDIGAGEGETAWFFKFNGAKNVIAVEPDSEAFEILSNNSTKHNFIAVNERLSCELIDFWLPKIDVIKCDVEGYEELLLDIEIPKPIMVEVHGVQLADKFKIKGYKLYNNASNYGTNLCICYASKNLF